MSPGDGNFSTHGIALRTPAGRWGGIQLQGCLNRLNQESIKSDFMIKSLIYSPHLTDLYNRSYHGQLPA
jgi:hypothetical protein